jgi:hypothetical protein
MSIIGSYNLFNKIEDGELDSNGLTAYLSTPKGKSEFIGIFTYKDMVERLFLLDEISSVITNNNTAMNAVIASATAMNAVIASATAMNAVAASATAMNAVIASATAKMAVFSSDTALNGIASSSVALTALRSASEYSLSAGISNGSLPSLNTNGSYILVGASSPNATNNQTISNLSTLRSGSSRPTSIVTTSSNSDATDVTMCTPIIAPFSITRSSTTGYTWYYGFLRCDI